MERQPTAKRITSKIILIEHSLVAGRLSSNINGNNSNTSTGSSHSNKMRREHQVKRLGDRSRRDIMVSRRSRDNICLSTSYKPRLLDWSEAARKTLYSSSMSMYVS